MRIRVSNQWLKHKFTCSLDFIKNKCKGRCCWGQNKLVIPLLPEEELKLIGLGMELCLKNGLLFPKSGKKCPFQSNKGLCILHNIGLKPFGCILSPFTINKNNTLIIRHRYSKFKCHNVHGIPSYINFRPSLELMFGNKIDEFISKLEKTDEDFYFEIEDNIYNNIIYLDALKKNG